MSRKAAVILVIAIGMIALFSASCQRQGATGQGGVTPAPPPADPAGVVKAYFQSLADKQFDKSWVALSGASKERVAESIAYNKPRARIMLDGDEDKMRTRFFTNHVVKGVGTMYARLAKDADIKEKSRDEKKAVVSVSLQGKTLDFPLVKEEGGWKLELFTELKKKK